MSYSFPCPFLCSYYSIPHSSGPFHSQLPPSVKIPQSSNAFSSMRPSLLLLDQKEPLPALPSHSLWPLQGIKVYHHSIHVWFHSLTTWRCFQKQSYLTNLPHSIPCLVWHPAQSLASFNNISWTQYADCLKNANWDFPGGPVVKNPPANAGDTGLIPAPGRFHMPGWGWGVGGWRGQLIPSHNYRACFLQPVGHNYWAHAMHFLKPSCSRAHALQQEKPLQWEVQAPQWRLAPTHHNKGEPRYSHEDPVQPKINFK